MKKVIEAAEKSRYDVLAGPISYHPLKNGEKTIEGGSFVHFQREDCVFLGEALKGTNDIQKYDAFDKWDKYGHQQEWRIVINKHIAEDTPIRFEIGDISDIVTKCDAREFETRITKLLQKHRIRNEVAGFVGNVDREKMRDDFYILGNEEGYILATMGKAEYSD